MHQPFYKDLVSGEYKLPWTRLHALKDYYGMVEILREFPNVRQTFNLVPSMMVAGGRIRPRRSPRSLPGCRAEARRSAHRGRPGLSAAAVPSSRSAAHDPSLPRYGELLEACQSQDSLETARRRFSAQDFRDLQVLSQLAWFDEEFRDRRSRGARVVRQRRAISRSTTSA